MKKWTDKMIYKLAKILTSKHIHLKISSMNGDFAFYFLLSRTIREVKYFAVEKLNMDKTNKYVLTMEGSILDESKTLRELNIPKNTRLFLEHKDVSGRGME